MKIIRTNFLDALLKVVGNEKLELDFVYGSIKKDKKGITTLQPLDGQQRLTTLFLLYWFVAIKESKLDDTLKELLTKFTYETRTSSREFCNYLINKGIVYNDKQKISQLIIDSSWFFLSWKKDPTIKSMLTMLDAIQQKFGDKTEVWDKLKNISFHYIELENFGLSDDLYIKMNARGKPLTDFENFKAKFEQYIEQNNWENGLELTKKFAHKIDTVWTDLFWKYRDEKDRMDDSLLKFLSSIAILLYAQNLEIFDNEEEKKSVRKELEDKNKGKNVTEDAVKRERIEKRIAELVRDFKTIKPIDFPTPNSFEYLKKCFDLYSNEKTNYDKLSPELNLWGYVNSNKTLFLDSIKSNEETTYRKRVLFYAQTNYLNAINENFNIGEFSNWLRVVRNIVENATIDSATTFIGAINLINELSVGSNSIYCFLSKNEIKSGFAGEQVKEEKRKAELIQKTNEIKNTIFELEDTDFCKGTINWCLECAQDDDIQKQLLAIKKIIDLHFGKSDISNLFRRALLTIGDNNFYDYWRSWSYNTETHKRCIIEDRNDLKNNFTRGKWLDDCLKPLIIKLYNSDLQSIVDNYIFPDKIPNWKKRLIKEPELFENYCQGHYMGFTDNLQRCYLYKDKKRPSSREECELVE